LILSRSKLHSTQRRAFLRMSSYSSNTRSARYENDDGRRTVGLNRHHALQNCATRPGERFHNSTNGLIKWNHRHQNSQMARERCACTPFLRRASLGSPSPYPIPIHPRNLLFVLTVNVVSALWNSLISQILPNNFRVTRHWIAFPRPVITKIPDASVSSSLFRRLRPLWYFRYGWKNFLQVAYMWEKIIYLTSCS